MDSHKVRDIQPLQQAPTIAYHLTIYRRRTEVVVHATHHKYKNNTRVLRLYIGDKTIVKYVDVLGWNLRKAKAHTRPLL